MQSPINVISLETAYTDFENDGKDFFQSRCLTIPLVFFDNSFEACTYAVNTLIHSPINCGISSQIEMLSHLSECSNFLRFYGEKFNISCKMKEPIGIRYRTEGLIPIGKPESIATFFELTFDHSNPEEEIGFNLNGETLVDGIIFAVTRKQNDHQIKMEKAFNLQKEIAHCKHVVISVKNNKLVSLNLDGVEKLEEVIFLAGERGGNITEFAFETNELEPSLINFAINSQINEGAKGFHIGVGDGRTGFHIDFICTTSNLMTSYLNMMN